MQPFPWLCDPSQGLRKNLRVLATGGSTGCVHQEARARENLKGRPSSAASVKKSICMGNSWIPLLFPHDASEQAPNVHYFLASWTAVGMRLVPRRDSPRSAMESLLA